MQSVFIIAEAGVNHNGELPIALKMIDAAVAAGADAIKFQTFKAEALVSKTAKKASYQEQTTTQEETQYDMLKKLELSYDAHVELIKYAQLKNIKFLSTPFDHSSIEMLDKLGLDIFKIPSGEITNLPYLEKIGNLKKKVILSTGMATMKEIEDALEILINAGTPKEFVTVLHATTEYPAPYEEINLNAINTIRNTFGVRVGYSDHTKGIEVPIAAVALGAEIIEKHFTLDRNMEGPDHKASLEPKELAEMICAIRKIEKSLGDGIKKPTSSELKNIPIVRKSIHFLSDLPEGHTVQAADLVMKRPGTGISPMELYQVINKRLKVNVYRDTILKWSDIQ